MPTRAELDRLVAVLTAPLAILALLRVAPGISGWPFDAIESYLGWALAPAWLAAIYASARRARTIAALAAPALVVHAALLARLVAPFAESGAHADDAAPTLRVVTANLYAGNREPERLADELASLDADVIALQEVTPRWRVVLDERGVLARFPHRVLEERSDCFGVALLSRTPFDATIEDLAGVPMIDARINTSAGDVRALVVHTLPPIGPDASTWNAQIALLARLVATSDDPVILLGDLNASPFGRAYRTLIDAGLRGAHETTGRGLATTWPNGTRALPPMRLDHILVSPAITPRTVREGEGAGSDHRPVIATLTLPAR